MPLIMTPTTTPSLVKTSLYVVIHILLKLQVREAYKTYMKTIAQLLGGAGVYSDQKMMNIYDFEKAIAQVRINSKVDAD